MITPDPRAIPGALLFCALLITAYGLEATACGDTDQPEPVQIVCTAC